MNPGTWRLTDPVPGLLRLACFILVLQFAPIESSWAQPADDSQHQEWAPPDETALTDQLKAVESLRQRFADASQAHDARRGALKDANQKLREIILEHPTHARVSEWRLELARSMLYQEAEPYCVNVLYSRDSVADRLKVKELAAEAGRLLEQVYREATSELDRIDQLPLRELERLDRQGVIEKTERLQAQSQYDLRWADFYRCLVMTSTDPNRIEVASRALTELVDESELLTTPHAVSGHQCQSLLLAGLFARLQGSPAQALTYLQQALEVFDALPDPPHRDRLRWAWTLIRVEQIRALTDSGSFVQALELADRFDKETSALGDAGSGLRLTLALEKCRVRTTQADQLLNKGEKNEADRVRAAAWKPVADMLAGSADQRDQIYAVLFARFYDSQTTSSLHLVEQCALAAGWLAEYDRTSSEKDTQPESRAEILVKAETIARQGWSLPSPDYAEAHAELGYNLGVILVRQGRPADAARQFLDVVKQHHSSKLASPAAQAAVNLAVDLRREHPDDAAIGELYVASLRAVTGPSIEGEVAGYWRFFLGQALLEMGQFDEAVVELGKVSASHEHALRAKFLRLRGLVASMERIDANESDRVRLRDRATEAVKAADEFARQAGAKSGQNPDISRMLAHALILKAMAMIAPGVGREEAAIDLLADFDSRYPGQEALQSELDLALLTAHALLGHSEAAAPLVARYLATNDKSHIARIQGLYERLIETIRATVSPGTPPPEGPLAETAWILADQLFQCVSQENKAAPRDRFLCQLQRAEAALRSGRLDVAQTEFERCQSEDEQQHGGGETRNLRIIIGLAETLFARQQYEAALPWFDRVFREWKEKDAAWWKSLLRNLQCRTELGHDAAGIVKSIEQQRFLDPELGGSEIRKLFVELEKRNRARLNPAANDKEGK